MTKVIAYARVSTDQQDLENQMYEVQRYLEREGLVLDELVEEKVSGTKRVQERELGRVIDQLSAGDTLIVAEVSRLSRRLAEIFNVIGDLIAKDVTVIAVKQNYVFGNDIHSQVIAFAFGLASQIERDLISQRTKEALARKKAEGIVLGRPVGSHKPEHLKLHGKDEEIINYLDKRVPASAIARLYGVNRATLQAYVQRQALKRAMLQRRWERSMEGQL